MVLTVDLPADLEARLAAGAARDGVAVTEYALRLLGRAPAVDPPADWQPSTPDEAIAWWEQNEMFGALYSQAILSDGSRLAG